MVDFQIIYIIHGAPRSQHDAAGFKEMVVKCLNNVRSGIYLGHHVDSSVLQPQPHNALHKHHTLCVCALRAPGQQKPLKKKH